MSSNPIEKLLEDIQYYERERKEARARLAVAEEVLPRLRESLDNLRRAVSEIDVGEAQEAAEKAEEASVQNAREEDNGNTVSTTRLFGTAEEQVEQALGMSSPQSSEDLKEFLAKHGKEFSQGAINHALRKLRTAGKIEGSHKEGNLRFYRLVSGEE